MLSIQLYKVGYYTVPALGTREACSGEPSRNQDSKLNSRVKTTLS